MLAKIWKKVLFAICVIACLFNIMNKLIKVTSLDEQLKSVVTFSENKNAISENIVSKD